MIARSFIKIFLIGLVCLAANAYSQTIDSLEIKINNAKGLAKAEAINDAVFIYTRSNLDKAKALVEDGYKFYEENKTPLVQCYAYLNQGLYIFSLGLPDSSIRITERGFRLATEQNYTPALIKFGIALGRMYISAGKPETALKHLYNTLNYLKSFPSKEKEMRVKVNIVWAYLELKRYKECIAFGRKSLDELPNTLDFITPYFCNNMAAAYGALKKVDSCRYFVLKGLPISLDRNDYNQAANSYFILGNAYSEDKQYDQAIEMYEKAKPYREKTGNIFYLVADLYVLAETYHQKGDFKNGVKTAQEALTLAEKNKINFKLEGVYQALANNYEGLKDYKNSSKYYNLLAAAKDSVYQHANADALAEMQTKYETEKKEQQIALLNIENNLKSATIQKNYFLIGGLASLILLISLSFYLIRYRDKQKQRAVMQEQKVRFREAQLSAAIDSQEKERKRFASDLHDGMGQLIAALQLNINAIKQNKNQEERDSHYENSEQILNDIHTEIRNIAFNLMPPVLIKEGLMAAVAELARRINKAGTIKVKLSQHDIPARFNELGEISLYRIIQELISNIVKHSSATEVMISFTGFDEEIVLTIEDNGNGYSLEKFKNSEGNGWRNIQSRVSLVKGSIEFDVVEERKNNTVIITVPMNSLKVDSITSDLIETNKP